jgi:hypothetical protein
MEVVREDEPEYINTGCNDFVDENKPHLKPQDLEDIASIFDTIRSLYKRKEEPKAVAKKLIVRISK